MRKNLTPEDNQKFDIFMKNWAVKLNLQNWRIERMPGTSKSMAEVMISLEDRLAAYKTGKHFGTTPINDHSLEQTAVHELLHVFLRDFADAVRSGNEDYVMSAEHSLITVLENLLLKDNHVSQN